MSEAHRRERGYHTPMRREVWRGGAVATAALVIVGACSDVTGDPPDTPCPNRFPVDGELCEPGLVCNYAEPTNCVPYFTATCSPDGTWSLDRPCGVGGTGGGGDAEGGMGNTGNLGGGGGGGEMCVDPVEGGPLVTSELDVVYAPDRGSGTYPLTFDEAVTGVGPSFSWAGPGTFDGVSKVGNVYRVRYSGLAPGDSATLTVDGVADSCGNAMDAPVDVTIGLLPSCHLFEEDFEGDFFGAGWSTVDNGVDGNVWASNADFDSPNGVENHTEGSGLSASANDIDSLAGTSWDAELIAPAIDLTGLSNVVLRYQTDFQDSAGAGEAWLEASGDGSSWSPLSTFTDDRTSREIVDLSDWAGAPVFLRWRYVNDGGLGSWWDVDDVCVEQFTKATCTCLPGGVTEIKDVDGVSDGNGDVFTAELTGSVLAQVGDRVIACGDLEQEAISGPDFFRFVVGAGAAPLNARVSYCIENAFQDATSGVWLKSDPLPLAQVTDAFNEGTYDVTLTPGLEHFVSIAAPTSPYTGARYRLTVDVLGVSTPLLSESFEVWPPLSFTITDEDPCADWLQATQTVVPSGSFPTQGNSLAYFNSYDCSTGSEALESGVLNFVGLSSLMLSIDMFHDPGFPGANDTIQVEYNTGSIWIPIGAPLTRPGTVAAWETHVIDLSALAGLSSVRIRLFATTAYGNHTHIDNVVLLSN